MTQSGSGKALPAAVAVTAGLLVFLAAARAPEKPTARSEQRVAAPLGGDTDGDGVADGADNCPLVPNPDQGDFDGFGPQHVISNSANGARSVFAADLDGDLDSDVLAASYVDDEIAWYENLDGAGAFGPPHVLTNAANWALSVYAADLDGDLDLDLDVLSASRDDDTVAWFENQDGLGHFGAEQVITSGANGAAAAIAADLDGDLDLDVLCSSLSDHRIFWFRNLGGGNFFGLPIQISNLAYGVSSLYAADLDGDLDLDVLAAASNTDEIAWYENLDGAGSFGPEQVITNEALGAQSVFAADLDGDLDLDVLSASYDDDTVAWYENLDGAGSFGPRQILTAAANGASAVFAADIGGDSDMDVLFASGFDNTVGWHENLDGAGSFGPRRVISNEADDPRSVFAADIDGDSDLDVLSASEDDDEIAWYEQLSDGAGDACDNCPALPNPGQADTDEDGLGDACDNCPAVANLDQADSDADGAGDACDNCPGVVNPSQAETDGDGLGDHCDNCPGVFNPGQADADGDGQGDDCDNCPDDANPGALDADADGIGDACDECVDPDGDGFGDPGYPAATCPVDNCPRIANPTQLDLDFDGAGDACDSCPGAPSDQRDFDGFAAPQPITSAVLGLRGLVAADLDGDGDSEIITAQYTADEISWFENLSGAGNFGPPQLITAEANGPYDVLAADLDGDSDLDVLGASYLDDEVAWYENLDGAGTFGPQRLIATDANGARAVFVAFVDGDADLDVLVASEVDDTIAWYENLDGAGGFGPARVISTDVNAPRAVFAADVDGDGDTDALSASFADEELAWYENLDGAGNFGPQHVIGTVTELPSTIFGADLDGDSDVDVLSGSTLGNTVVWYENLDGAGNFGPQRYITHAADNVRDVRAVDIDGDSDADVISASISDGKIAWYENLDGAGNFGPQRVLEVGFFSAFRVVAADLEGDGGIDVVAGSLNSLPLRLFESLADGVADVCDNCPDAFNPAQTDIDADGVGDACDNCPGQANEDQSDVDGDAIGDPCDPCPLDPLNDFEQDGFCANDDNCPVVPNPDQLDADTDGHGDVCDCSPADGTVWDTPGEVPALGFGPGKTTLFFTAPAEPGGVAPLYDTLRSTKAFDFVGALFCVESDDASDLTAEDGDLPAAGKVFFYLIRAETACGAGALGDGSAGPRPPAGDCE